VTILGRKFKYKDKQVKEAILRIFTEQEVTKLGFRPLHRELKKDPKAKIGGFTTLQRCLKKYVDDGFLKRDETGQYEITEKGRLSFSTDKDRKALDNTKKKFQKELEPELDGKFNVLPFNASLYLSHKVELEFGIEVTPNPKELANEICYFFEKIFYHKFKKIASDWFDHKLLRMKPDKRRDFLRLHHPDTDRTSDMAREIERKIRSMKSQEREPILTPENLLDIEGIFLVHLERERLRKDSHNILRRLMSKYLNTQNFEASYESFVILAAFAKLGMITHEEYEEYLRTKNDAKRSKLLEQLKVKYSLDHVPGFGQFASEAMKKA
jgi:hypothetical protein